MRGIERGALTALVLSMACHRAPAPPATASATPTFADTTLQSAAKFTQDFYGWYRQRDMPMDSAVGLRPELFERTLLAALDSDFAAQARVPGEIVGLDWDAFTGSQDPCDTYTVMGATRSGDTVTLPIRGTCRDAAPPTAPDVIAQVRRTATSWVFVDFRHADDKGSLRQDLAELKQERDSSSGHRKR